MLKCILLLQIILIVLATSDETICKFCKVDEVCRAVKNRFNSDIQYKCFAKHSTTLKTTTLENTENTVDRKSESTLNFKKTVLIILFTLIIVYIAVTVYKRYSRSEADILRNKLEQHRITWQTTRPVTRYLTTKPKTAQQYANMIMRERRQGKFLKFQPKLEPIPEEPEEY